MTEPKKLPVHPEDFTDCWSNDERMNFFFSAFPSKQSDNPHHWDTKMKFWVDLIHNMAENMPCAYATWENLFSKLYRNNKEPLGLSTVFINLINNGDLIPLDQYIQDIKTDETWVGWGVKWCVKKPANWVVDRVMSPVKSNPRKMMKSSKFVCKSALEKKSVVLFSSLCEFVSKDESHQYHILNIISYTKLCEIAAATLHDEESVNIVLETMRKRKLIEIWPLDDVGKSGIMGDTKEKYVKFAKSYHSKTSPFSEADIGIVRLCESKSILEQQIQDCYTEISQSIEKAKACLKKKQKQLAINALRRKKRLEVALIAKEKSLGNQEEILEKLNQCKTDKMVMETYKSAVAAYKELSNEVSVREIQATMDDVAYVLDKQSEISEILSESVNGEEDLQELETELADLLVDDGTSANLDDLCDKFVDASLSERLPEVPNDSPANSQYQYETGRSESHLTLQYH